MNCLDSTRLVKVAERLSCEAELSRLPSGPVFFRGCDRQPGSQTELKKKHLEE